VNDEAPAERVERRLDAVDVVDDVGVELRIAEVSDGVCGLVSILTNVGAAWR
jgi:hypothetical protein